jgi:hypothetical protein
MDSEALRQLVLSHSVAVGLDIDESHLDGVLGYLTLSASMFESLKGLELGPEDDASIVFVPRPFPVGHGGSTDVS